jgi:integrase
MAAALRVCAVEFVPWLVLCGFGLLRSAELYASGDKSPIAWEDLLWGQGVIRIRPETAKTARKRVAPLHPVLVRWLAPLRGVGPICGGVTPYARKRPETATLAQAAGLGSWPANVLRHSAISYRAAAVGLGLASMEAGNSESEARRSYNDAKTAADAEAWFGLTPEVVKRPWPVALPFPALVNSG